MFRAVTGSAWFDIHIRQLVKTLSDNVFDAIKDLTSRLGGLEIAFRDHAANLNAWAELSTGRVDTLNDDIRSVEERLDEVESANTDPLNDFRNTTCVRLDQVEMTVDHLRNEVSALREGMAVRLGRMEDTIAGIKARLEADIDQKEEECKGRHTELKEHVSTLESLMDVEPEESDEENEQVIAVVQRRIDEIDREINTERQRLAAYTAKQQSTVPLPSSRSL